MKLSQIVKDLFYESGQYIIGNLSDIKLNMEGIWSAFRIEIENYQAFCPLEKRLNLNVQSYFMYDFTFDSNNVGYSFGNSLNHDFGDTTFTAPADMVVLQLPNQNIQPTTVNIQFNGSDVATDDGIGNLVFSVDPYVFTGLVNYQTGQITIYVQSLGSTETVDVEVQASWVNPGLPPRAITSLKPVGTMQVISVLAYWMSPMVRDIWSPNRLVEPRMFLFEYDRPQLYYSETGWLDVSAIYDYAFNEITTTDGSGCTMLSDVDIPEIEKNKNFYILKRILLGKFQQILGKSRRAFVFNDMPITTDADTLVKEGTEIYNEAIKLLYQRHDWFNSIRN